MAQATRKKNTESLNATSKLDATKRTKVRGATRTPNTHERNPVRWGRYVVGVFVLSGLGYGILQVDWQGIITKAENAAHRPIAQVHIEGEFIFISREKIQNLLTKRLQGDFVDINLKDIKAAIEANAWVNRVSIQRTWPDSLKVTIFEERPIARWSNSGFINREGKLIKADIGNLLDKLPQLSGIESKSGELTQNYLLFTKLLSKSQLKVAGLSVDEKYSWEILLDQNIRLKLGQGDIQKKLENFLFVYENYLKNESQNIAETKSKKIKSIDMRYDQGMAVQWESIAENAISGKENHTPKNNALAIVD
ncbi:Cell division protein FtsQ [Thalassocella blandensis]|nr:Cell division protein FtsQ [Thalassocella blandensis]